MNKIDNDKQKLSILAILEAIIFASGKPVEKADLEAFFDLSSKDLEDLIKQLKIKYEDSKHGFELRIIGSAVAFATKTEVKDEIAGFFNSEIKRTKLTQANYETLAVVAYNEPVTRADIEEVRGVNSDSALHRLIEKGLVEMTGTLDAPGRPALFGVTELFLQLYGIENLNQLEPMDMLMYETIRDFETSYHRESDVDDKESVDSGEDLGTVY